MYKLINDDRWLEVINENEYAQFLRNYGKIEIYRMITVSTRKRGYQIRFEEGLIQSGFFTDPVLAVEALFRMVRAEMWYRCNRD